MNFLIPGVFLCLAMILPNVKSTVDLNAPRTERMKQILAEVEENQSKRKAIRKPFEKKKMTQIINGIVGGVIPDPNFEAWASKHYRSDTSTRSIPTSFHVNETWPFCHDSFERSRTQGQCKSCWAMTPVAVIADRLCIKTKGQTKDILMSPQDVIECCPDCGTCLEGGMVEKFFDYVQENGIVTGGDYNLYEPGCKPYTNESFNNASSKQECRKTCVDGYGVSYDNDKIRINGSVLIKGEEQMQLEILNNGPISATLNVYTDMLTPDTSDNENETAVYQHEYGSKIGKHNMKIIGWGEQKNEEGTMEPYWLAVNTWGRDFPVKNGYLMKIERHDPDLKLEEEAYAVYL